jgi:hypothetical protein
MQPKWCQVDDDGCPRKIGVGDLSKLKVSGMNGLLNAIMALAWWRNAVLTDSDVEWLEAVREVQWVLTRQSPKA